MAKSKHGSGRSLYPVHSLTELTDIQLRTLYGHVLRELEFRTCGHPSVGVHMPQSLTDVKLKEEKKLG